MQKDDLTQVKNIGGARKKLLANHSITSVQQLYEMPLDKLAQIKGLGRHYAKLIKDAVNDLYGPKAQAPGEPVAAVSPSEKQKPEKANSKLNAELVKTTRHLKRAKKKFEPINKKKHLRLFVDFKKKSNDLKTQILNVRRLQLDLPKKRKKKIVKQAASLNLMLKSVSKQKKGKTMRKLSQEIQSLLNLLSK